MHFIFKEAALVSAVVRDAARSIHARNVIADQTQEGKKKLSNRQRKMMNQMKIAELKQLAERPDVVEVWDVTAPDPQLLVYLKVCLP